ncbi:clathrin light chain [Apiospora arundinis]
MPAITIVIPGPSEAQPTPAPSPSLPITFSNGTFTGDDLLAAVGLDRGWIEAQKFVVVMAIILFALPFLALLCASCVQCSKGEEKAQLSKETANTPKVNDQSKDQSKSQSKCRETKDDDSESCMTCVES